MPVCLLLTTDGRLTVESVTDPVADAVRKLLDCTELETLRLPIPVPIPLPEGVAVCCCIDGQGREHQRPLHPVGTCLYPHEDSIAGDLVLAIGDRARRHPWESCEELCAFSRQDAQTLSAWLQMQFPTVRSSPIV